MRRISVWNPKKAAVAFESSDFSEDIAGWFT